MLKGAAVMAAKAVGFKDLLLVIGFGALINAAGIVWQAFQTTHWPQVKGTINVKEIARGVGPVEEKSRQYRADIAFRYQVDDECHMGDKVSVEFAPWWTRDYYKAKRILMRYPVGEDVIVYYDPNDPSNGVLDPGVSSATLVGSIIRVLIVAACFVGAFFVKPRRVHVPIQPTNIEASRKAFFQAGRAGGDHRPHHLRATRRQVRTQPVGVSPGK